MTSDRALIKKIRKSIKEVRVPGILSMSCVGSFIGRTTLDAVTDVDLVIITKNDDAKTYRQILSAFDNIKDTLSKEVEIVIEPRCIAIKPLSEANKRVVQLHLLIFDKKLFTSMRLAPAIFSWINFSSCWLGISLRKLRKAPTILAQDVITDIDHRINNLNTRTSYGDILTVKKEKLIRKKLSIPVRKEQWPEVLCFIPIVCTLNYFRVRHPKMHKNEKVLLTAAKKSFPLRQAKFLETVFTTKENLASGKEVPKKTVAHMEKNCASFLRFLRTELEGKDS